MKPLRLGSAATEGSPGRSTPTTGMYPRGWALGASGATRRPRVRMSPMTQSRMVESSRLYVRTHRRCVALLFPLGHPGEIGLLALEDTADGVHQHGVGRAALETTGFFEGQDALDPTVAFVTGRPQGPFAPEDAEPQGPLCAVVGGVDPIVHEKDPQRVHLP